MSERIYTISGTKIFIGKDPMQPKLEVEPSDFAGVSWVEIGGAYNFGELGAEQAINEFELINSDWMIKSKGTRNGGTMTNQFIPLSLDSGQMKVLEAVASQCDVYPIKLERGADCAPQAAVTFSDSSGDILVAWVGSDFSSGQPVTFENDGGALPSGISAGVIYYVVNPSTDSFSVSATAGGTPVAFTDAGTATTTATASPAGMTDMFQSLVGDGARSGGGKNDPYLRTWNFAVNGRIITV